MQESTSNNFSVIKKHFGSNYEVVADRVMGEISVIVFVKSDLVSSISNVETWNVGVGLGGIGSNKGGVLVSLTYESHKIAFINVHLAARNDRKRLVRRNADARNVLHHLKAGNPALDVFSEFNTFFFGDSKCFCDFCFLE